MPATTRRPSAVGRRPFLRNFVATLVLMTAAFAPPLSAQATLRPEIRLDYLGGRTNALHAGAGLSVLAGTYVRVGGNAGIGTGAHADVTARFMLDPNRQSRIGASVGGGVGVRWQDDRPRAFALLIADVELGRGGGWAPFVSAGVGGGPRFTVGLRRAATAGR